MEKNNREKYFEAWLLFLKGRNQIDPKALAESLSENLKGALSPTTMKRYNATVIANLYENGFLFGKPGKPLEIVQEITLPILDKSLTANYKKIKFAEIEKATAPAEPAPEAPTAKKPKTVKKKVKKPEVAAEPPPEETVQETG